MADFKFLTWADLERRLPRGTLNKLVGQSTNLVAEACADAEDMIAAHLRQDKEIDVVLGLRGTSRNRVLVTIGSTLAVCRVMEQTQPDYVGEYWQKQYEAAMKQLREIRDGKLRLDRTPNAKDENNEQVGHVLYGGIDPPH